MDRWQAERLKRPAAADRTGPIEQLLVMHCLKEDSVLGREGFSVRAASPGATDQATFDWALRLESYELPLDMKSGPLLPNQAPRRLALVPGPPGRVALVHTAYLPRGYRRAIPQLHLADPPASRAGNLAGRRHLGLVRLADREYPRGETKSLPTLDDLPRGSLIDEAALTAFLSGASAPADQSLARSIYPGRVESNPEARRRWVRAALHGFLRGRRAERDAGAGLHPRRAGRGRAPGLRDRPAPAAADRRHVPVLDVRAARTRRSARTRWPGSSAVTRATASIADSDALRRRGYVVDTFRDAYGPDLLVEPSWPLEGLLNLVAEGDWNSRR